MICPKTEIQDYEICLLRDSHSVEVAEAHKGGEGLFVKQQTMNMVHGEV